MIRINNPQYFYFLQQADALRHSGSLCDAVISVKSQTFRAHRLVLACASRSLAQRLAPLGDVDNPVHCKLDHFSPRTFQQVLDFTYTQTLEVSVEDLHLLLRAAQLLEMQPLEDQCRKHLATIHCKVRQESKPSGISHGKKEAESTKQAEEKEKESLALERENSLTWDEARNDIVMEKNSPAGPLKNHSTSPPSAKKKPSLPAVSAALYKRESVITRPVSSGSSSSPWTFPNMWNSVSTLRQIAENYSNLVAAQPFQPPRQSVAYPFSLTSTHMLPLLGSHFQSSVMACSGFHPGHDRNLYVGSTRTRSIINQGMLKRKINHQASFIDVDQTGERSNCNGPAASIARVKDCQQTGTSLLQGAASSPSGEACAGCQFSGSDDAQLKPKNHQQEHREDKPHQCHHCPKKFSLKHQLDTHHRVHTGEKPFECRLCGQRSRDYSAMIKHLRTHGGASPYQCTVCLEFCSSLVAMQRHVKSHALQDFPQNWSINSTYLYKSHI